MSQEATLDDVKKITAAQNVQEGLITVADLSSLTGLEVAQLTKLAKTGQIAHYGEYHGKRFFNFQELVVWAHTSGDFAEARTTIRQALRAQMEMANCPFFLEEIEVDGEPSLKVAWKALPLAA